MIFEAAKLKIIFDILYQNEYNYSNLEITSNSEYLTISVNYGDLYYISYVNSVSNEVNHDVSVDNFYAVLSNDCLRKVNQIINLWPKCSIEIKSTIDHVSIEIVNYGNVVREKIVSVDCIFEFSKNDYLINPPTMKYNCSVNSRNLKQMLEFCNENKGVCISTNKKNNNFFLLITDQSSMLTTEVELEEMINIPQETIKLSTEAIKLIVAFLNKLVIRNNLVYLLFLESEQAFSIKVNIDENTYVQIYTIHD